MKPTQGFQSSYVVLVTVSKGSNETAIKSAVVK